jgi:hypothetical protein
LTLNARLSLTWWRSVECGAKVLTLCRARRAPWRLDVRQAQIAHSSPVVGRIMEQLRSSLNPQTGSPH